jgi:hypothetical protein
MRTITTARDVVKLLGGNREVSRLTRSRPKAVYYWTGQAKTFPAKTYCVMTDELTELRLKAPRQLWNMVEKPKPKKPKGKSNGKQRRSRAAGA